MHDGKPRSLNRRLSLGPVFFGLLLLSLAIGISNSGWESLTGRPAHSLAWGPLLFRALLALHGLVLLAVGVFRRTVSAPLPQATLGLSSRTLWGLGGLSLLAIALRLWGLASPLWLDEVLTLVDFARPPVAHILTSFPNQNQHMLYSLAAHFSLTVFGESGWALRLPAVVFGVACLWPLFLLARRLAGERDAWLVCGLMAISYHHIWFSQSARGYTGLLFFAVLATWWWLQALDTPSWRSWLKYAAACFLGAWIHSTMIFVLAGHGLVWLLFLARAGSPERKAGFKPLAAWALCGSLTLQAMALSFPEYLAKALHEASPPQSEWTNVWWVLRESLRSLQIGFSGMAVLMCGALLVFVGWISILRRDARAALLITLPPILGGSVMLALSHNLWPRFFFFSMGFALIIVAHGILRTPVLLAAATSRFVSMRNWAPAAGTIVACLTMLASAATLPRYYRTPKQDYPGARDFVEARRTTGAVVITTGLAGHAYGRLYAPQWPVIDSAPRLEQILQEPAELYLVYTLPIEIKGFRPEVWRLIESHFETVRVFPGTLGGGEIYVSRKRPLRLAQN